LLDRHPVGCDATPKRDGEAVVPVGGIAVCEPGLAVELASACPDWTPPTLLARCPGIRAAARDAARRRGATAFLMAVGLGA
jgi:hypothetical protein